MTLETRVKLEAAETKEAEDLQSPELAEFGNQLSRYMLNLGVLVRLPLEQRKPSYNDLMLRSDLDQLEAALERVRGKYEFIWTEQQLIQSYLSQLMKAEQDLQAEQDLRNSQPVNLSQPDIEAYTIMRQALQGAIELILRANRGDMTLSGLMRFARDYQPLSQRLQK